MDSTTIFPIRVSLPMLQLLKMQMRGRLTRSLANFRGTRRLVLSIIAVCLAAFWMANIAAGVMFREAADPQRLRLWIPLGLLAYALFQAIKIACRKPVEPFEWTAAEREMVMSAPVGRCDLIFYRAGSIGGATLAKALLFSVVMLPDLNFWLAGFVGIALALLFIDLVRLIVETVVYSMRSGEFARFRVGVLATLAALLAIAGFNALQNLTFVDGGANFFQYAGALLQELMDLRFTTAGSILRAPFEVFSSLILSGTNPWSLVQGIAAGCALIWLSLISLAWLDDRCGQRIRSRGELEFESHRQSNSDAELNRTNIQRKTWIPPRVFGAGSIAWRQLRGVAYYRSSVLMAFLFPAALSFLPLFSETSTAQVIVFVVGSLAFYTLVLMPSAIVFDFRRDVDRIAMLRALPISDRALITGQLSIPVSLCLVFQTIVLTIAMITHQFHVGWVIGSILVLLPINITIFALENLIFMWFPYRLNGEGINVFLRTSLTFTGKGLLFAVGLLVVLVIGKLSLLSGSQLFPDGGWGTPTIFAAGVAVVFTVSAGITTTLLIRAYRRFDPSRDVPA